MKVWIQLTKTKGDSSPNGSSNSHYLFATHIARTSQHQMSGKRCSSECKNNIDDFYTPEQLEFIDNVVGQLSWLTASQLWTLSYQIEPMKKINATIWLKEYCGWNLIL